MFRNSLRSSKKSFTFTSFQYAFIFSFLYANNSYVVFNIFSLTFGLIQKLQKIETWNF